ncbi:MULTISPECIES: phosphotransferase enzyme family protein [Kribbella]|uniref:Aminoglycoside phosphotransferase domain-containing protein n=1 Tax=Kribbella karoonensis TaxID=324851 RepID=A0ABN2CUP6_9ACTN
MEAVPEALLGEVRARYGVVAKDAEAISGGTASKLWRLSSEPSVVIRLSQYYPLPEQQWSCKVAAEFAGTIPEVIAPLAASDGEAAFLWQGHPITVWPFVMGAPLDRQNPLERRQAARLLARLHISARVFPGLGEGVPPARDDSEAERLFPDRELDEWLRSRHGHGGDEPVGWMHRDFFPGNVLCREGRIVGVVDWDEVEWGPLINELAWSVWEFGKTPAGDALDLDHALEFLGEYQRAGGPVRPSNALIPLIRARLRSGIAFWRRVHAADPVEDEAMVEAFAALRQVRLNL